MFTDELHTISIISVIHIHMFISSRASSEEVTQAQTAPLLVSVDTRGYAAVVIAKWGVEQQIMEGAPLSNCLAASPN